MPYQSTKQFGHDLGLSCCFRQWRAESHCNQLHGYAIAIRLVFEAEELDVRKWVVDFGSLKSLKQMFVDTFDHKLLVAEDDPDKDDICALAGMGIEDVIVVPAVGCEKFAEYVFGATEVWLQSNGYTPRVKLISAEVREHGANSAIYTGE